MLWTVNNRNSTTSRMSLELWLFQTAAYCTYMVITSTSHFLEHITRNIMILPLAIYLLAPGAWPVRTRTNYRQFKGLCLILLLILCFSPCLYPVNLPQAASPIDPTSQHPLGLGRGGAHSVASLLRHTGKVFGKSIDHTSLNILPWSREKPYQWRIAMTIGTLAARIIYCYLLIAEQGGRSSSNDTVLLINCCKIIIGIVVLATQR